tara:strand:- start:1427 stop:1717 length:291 start_codon:yes stop_codon:yes gene_type:complete
MKFKSYNRYINIELIEDEIKENNSLVVLPTDYKKPERPYALGKVIDWAPDVKLSLEKGEIVIFEKRMLNKIEVYGKMHYLVLENYIYGGIVTEEGQ